MMKKTLKPINQNVYDAANDKNGNRFGGNSFRPTLNIKDLKLERWKPKEGRNLINIIPFAAEATNPMVVCNKVSEGDTLYSLDYFVHPNVGPNQVDVPCLKQFGRNCPCCNEDKRIHDMGQKSTMWAKRRVVYVIHDLLSDTYGVWDTGYKSVEMKILQEISYSAANNNGAIINPMDPENGCSIEFQGVKSTFNGREYFDPDRFRFVERGPLTDAELEHSVDLSTVVNFMNEDEMERVISGEVTPSAPKPVVENNTTSSLASQAASDEPSAPKASAGKTCPYGHPFHEADKHDECLSCPVWADCAE